MRLKQHFVAPQHQAPHQQSQFDLTSLNSTQHTYLPGIPIEDTNDAINTNNTLNPAGRTEDAMNSHQQQQLQQGPAPFPTLGASMPPSKEKPKPPVAVKPAVKRAAKPPSLQTNLSLEQRVSAARAHGATSRRILDDGTVVVDVVKSSLSNGWSLRLPTAQLLFPEMVEQPKEEVQVAIDVLGDDGDVVEYKGALSGYSYQPGRVHIRSTAMMKDRVVAIGDKLALKAAGVRNGFPAVIARVERTTSQKKKKKPTSQQTKPATASTPEVIESSKDQCTIEEQQQQSDDDGDGGDGVLASEQRRSVRRAKRSLGDFIDLDDYIVDGIYIHRAMKKIMQQIEGEKTTKEAVKESEPAPAALDPLELLALTAQEEQQDEQQQQEFWSLVDTFTKEDTCGVVTTSGEDALVEVDTLLEAAGLSQWEAMAFHKGFSDLTVDSQKDVWEYLTNAASFGNVVLRIAVNKLLNEFASRV